MFQSTSLNIKRYTLGFKLYMIRFWILILLLYTSEIRSCAKMLSRIEIHNEQENVEEANDSTYKEEYAKG